MLSAPLLIYLKGKGGQMAKSKNRIQMLCHFVMDEIIKIKHPKKPIEITDEIVYFFDAFVHIQINRCNRPR